MSFGLLLFSCWLSFCADDGDGEEDEVGGSVAVVYAAQIAAARVA